jgi:hypothetical protein
VASDPHHPVTRGDAVAAFCRNAVDALRVVFRSICHRLDEEIEKKSLRSERRKYECLPGETERSAFVDRAGRVRKLARKGGSEDASLSVEQCFDEAGQLRFAFFVAGAVNGSHLDLRMYFDPSGRLLWKQSDLGGPGYIWSLDAWLVPHAPRNAFESPALCN